MKLQVFPLVLSSLLLNLVNSAPSPRRDLVKPALESRSNNSSGVISIPFKKHRRENNGAQAVRRDGQLGQVNLINGGPDYTILAELQFGTPPQTFEIQIDTGVSTVCESLGQFKEAAGYLNLSAQLRDEQEDCDLRASVSLFQT